MTESSTARESLESYRPYLRVLAGLHLDRRLRAKVEASDIVQQTLLKAQGALPGLNDHRPEAMAAWLRKILANELADAARHFHRARRDVARECSLAAELDESAAGLSAWLAAEQTSPSGAAARNEDLLRLANALLALPDELREAVVDKHVRQLPLAQIAAASGRTPASVAGLLRRGLAKLRERLREE